LARRARTVATSATPPPRASLGGATTPRSGPAKKVREPGS
jgi:hypothetical protein